MSEKIAKEQFDNLDYAESFDIQEYNALLKEYTGIVAVPYTAYSYYDSVGNYLGDSTCDDTRGLLRAAYIEVIDHE